MDLLRTSCLPLLQLPFTGVCHCLSQCHGVMLPLLLLVSHSPLSARSAAAAGICGQLLVPLAHRAPGATRHLAAELTLCVAAICVSPLYPATGFLKACQNTISSLNLCSDQLKLRRNNGCVNIILRLKDKPTQFWGKDFFPRFSSQ